MQGGWQPPSGGGGGYGAPPGGGGYGAPPGGGAYGQPPGGAPPGFGAPPPSMGFQQNPYGQPGGPQMGGMGQGPAQYGNYEFNDTENSVIDKTASRAKLWGTISIVIGALECLSSCGAFASVEYAKNLPVGIVGIVVGVSFLGVGNSLKQVVQTQGNDSMHLMQAMQKISGAFMIQIICAVVGFVLYVIAALLIAMFAVAVAASS